MRIALVSCLMTLSILGCSSGHPAPEETEQACRNRMRPAYDDNKLAVMRIMETCTHLEVPAATKECMSVPEGYPYDAPYADCRYVSGAQQAMSRWLMDVAGPVMAQCESEPGCAEWSAYRLESRPGVPGP